MTKELVTSIDILRHGACEGGEIYRGSTDVELSAEGWQQMESAVEHFGGWQRVVTSPMARCHQFAQRYASRADLPIEIDNGFREMGFGEWEGQKVKDVWQAEPELVRAYYQDPVLATPPGGEPILKVQERMVAAWESLLNHHAGEHILLVAHSGVIRLLLSHVLSMPLFAISGVDVPYACITRLKVFHHSDRHIPVLISHNPLAMIQ